MYPEPASEKDLWPGAKLVEYDPPKNHDQDELEIQSLVGVVDWTENGIRQIHFKIKVDDLDIDLLKENGFFWVVFWGGVAPFNVAHPEADESTDVDGSEKNLWGADGWVCSFPNHPGPKTVFGPDEDWFEDHLIAYHPEKVP